VAGLTSAGACGHIGIGYKGFLLDAACVDASEEAVADVSDTDATSPLISRAMLNDSDVADGFSFSLVALDGQPLSRELSSIISIAFLYNQIMAAIGQTA